MAYDAPYTPRPACTVSTHAHALTVYQKLPSVNIPHACEHPLNAAHHTHTAADIVLHQISLQLLFNLLQPFISICTHLAY